MADETIAPAVADTTTSVEEPTRPTDAIAEPAVAEAKPDEGGIIATEGVAEGVYCRVQSYTEEANESVDQFPRPTTLRKSLPRKKTILPTRSQKPKRLVMTQVSQN
jgi:hypothetical protein